MIPMPRLRRRRTDGRSSHPGVLAILRPLSTLPVDAIQALRARARRLHGLLVPRRTTSSRRPWASPTAQCGLFTLIGGVTGVLAGLGDDDYWMSLDWPPAGGRQAASPPCRHTW